MPLLAGFLGGQSCLPLSWCHLLAPPMQQGQFLHHNSILISWHRSHFWLKVHIGLLRSRKPFFHRLDSHGLPIPVQTCSGKRYLWARYRACLFSFLLVLADRAPIAQRHVASQGAQSGKVWFQLLDGQLGWGGGVRRALANRLWWAFSGNGAPCLEAIPAMNSGLESGK